MAEERVRSAPPGPGGRRQGFTLKEVGQSIPTMKRLLTYSISTYKIQAILVVVCIAAAAFVQIQGTMFMKTLIDDYIMPLLNAESPDFSPLFSRLIILAALFLVGVLASYIRERIMIVISQGTMLRLRNELFTNMETLPIGYFDTHAHGDIMSVYTNDVDTLRQMISQTIPQIINSMITIVMAFVSMVIVNIPLTCMVLVMVAIMIAFAGKLGSLSSKYYTKQQNSLGIENGYIEEMMSGQKVVKVFCHEDKSIEEFTALNDELRKNSDLANRISNMLMPLTANIGNISYVLCAVLGAGLALSGITGLTLGSLVTFLTLNRNFTMPVTQISMQLSAIVMAQAGAKRVFALMDEKSEDDAGKVTLVRVNEDADGNLTETDKLTGTWAWKKPASDGKEEELKKLCGDVSFENVDFSYTSDKQILYDVKMYAEPGQKIALVGSTGAGKTTITNLITRFYDIQGGAILFDGINIMDIKKADLRHSLGMVLQETNLFTGTVMENIRFGRLDATDEECIQAAKLANADGFIRRLPDGYNTMLTGSGSNLSQGQRQLLSIARAAVEDPPVLILDEATSSIDTRTERLVQNGMDALMKGRTTFVIAHRLSTIMNSDCIMVVEEGRIIERGSHDQLLREQGRYYQLYTGNPAVKNVAS